MTKVKKNKSIYKVSLLGFTVICIILGICFLSYVYRSLIIYEENLEENIVKTMLKNGELAEKYKLDFKINKYDNDNDKTVIKNLKELYKDKNINYKKTKSKSGGVEYQIYLNKNLITTIELEIKSTSTRLGLLQINEWKIKDIKYNFENGFYNYKITIPSSYKLLINNKDVTEEGKKNEDSSLAKLAKYTNIDSTKTYELNNFISKPNITIKDSNNKDIKYTLKDSKIEIENKLTAVSYDKIKLKQDFNLLKLAEDWSLFLTDDLGGQLHGLYKLTPYLINDTAMYKRAYDWATQVDITFTSNHYLLNPVFTKEEIKNCYQYNDDAFSCEVYFEKNLVVRGETKALPLHERMYIVFYENQYRLVDMMAITE